MITLLLHLLRLLPFLCGGHRHDRAELAAPSLSTSLGNALRTPSAGPPTRRRRNQSSGQKHGRGQSPVGAPRIHGELLKLGIDVAEPTVSRLLPKRHSPPSQTWRMFLTNHVRDLVSVDFFTVPTARLRVLFVFVVLAHDRRRVLHFNVTEHRTTAWTTQQIGDAFPDDSAPSYLLRDRDSVYGHVFRQRLKCMRVRSLCQDGAPDCLPRLASVVAANAVCGAVIGFCVPTWYRMPQTMTVDYRGWNIRFAARTGDAGRMWTTTRIAAPTATTIGTTLVSKNGHLMAEEAIADAMDQARRFIGRAHDDA